MRPARGPPRPGGDARACRRTGPRAGPRHDRHLEAVMRAGPGRAPPADPVQRELGVPEHRPDAAAGTGLVAAVPQAQQLDQGAGHVEHDERRAVAAGHLLGGAVHRADRGQRPPAVAPLGDPPPRARAAAGAVPAPAASVGPGTGTEGGAEQRPPPEGGHGAECAEGATEPAGDEVGYDQRAAGEGQAAAGAWSGRSCLARSAVIGSPARNGSQYAERGRTVRGGTTRCANRVYAGA